VQSDRLPQRAPKPKNPVKTAMFWLPGRRLARKLTRWVWGSFLAVAGATTQVSRTLMSDYSSQSDPLGPTEHDSGMIELTAPPAGALPPSEGVSPPPAEIPAPPLLPTDDPPIQSETCVTETAVSAVPIAIELDAPAESPATMETKTLSPEVAKVLSVGPLVDSVPFAHVPPPAPVGDVDINANEDDDSLPMSMSSVTRSSPPWLISMIFHMLVLILLGVWMLKVTEEKPLSIEVAYADTLGEQLDDDLFELEDVLPLEVIDTALSLDDLPLIEDPLTTPPIDPFETETPLDSTPGPTSITIALDGRREGRKSTLLAAYGGDEVTEEAVQLGLAWLRRNQRRDGSWSLQGPYAYGAARENKIAATAMALLAFQGAGHTHQQGAHRQNVARGWHYLLSRDSGQQQGDGSFFRQGAGIHRFYTHAQATIALCELYGMTKDPKYKKPAQKAIDYLVATQAPEGGWRYWPGRESDTSVTGWVVMALQSARMAGLEVPEKTFDEISRYLDRASAESGRLYSYQPGSTPSYAMSAEGLLCRQYLGWRQDDERLVDGVSRLVERPIKWSRRSNDVYYWYYATQAAHHMEGKLWTEWNSHLRKVLPENQVKKGRDAGSWSPRGDRHADSGGRLYMTALSIYMLEVYYRHLPIYQAIRFEE